MATTVQQQMPVQQQQQQMPVQNDMMDIFGGGMAQAVQ
jgi:hypothetical protein